MPPSEIIRSSLEMIVKDPSKVLGMTVGNHTVTPGLYIPKAEAQAPPELYLEHPSSTENLLAISLDPDAPFPSFSFLGPILHWVQPDLTPTPSDSDSSITTLNSASPQIMDYAPPGPPPGSSPHKYVFLLFKQPPGFDSKKYVPKGQQEMGIKARIRTDVEKWVAEKGLGPVVAANYFTSN